MSNNIWTNSSTKRISLAAGVAQKIVDGSGTALHSNLTIENLSAHTIMLEWHDEASVSVGRPLYAHDIVEDCFPSTRDVWAFCVSDASLLIHPASHSHVVRGSVIADVTFPLDAADTPRDPSTEVIPVQVIDASGSVLSLPMDPANTPRSAATEVLAVQSLDSNGRTIGQVTSSVNIGSEYHSPSDFSCSYASPSGVTLAGLPFTPTSEQLLGLSVYQPGSGVEFYSPQEYNFDWNATTGVLSLVGLTDFRADSTFRAIVAGQQKGYNLSSNTSSVVVANPLSSQRTASTLGTLNTETSAYYYIDCDGYRTHGLQFVIAGTASGSIGYSLQDDSTAADACNYIEATQTEWSVPYISSSAYKKITDPLPIKYLRIKASCAAASSITIYHVGLY